MIQANELRIGNWVNWKDEPVRVWGLKEGVYVEGSDLPREEEIEPIPLTPEILEKCGFEKRFIFDDEYIFTDSFYIDENGRVFYTEWEGSDNRGGLENRYFTEVKHLHQLQNLYFVLIGTELTYTP